MTSFEFTVPVLIVGGGACGAAAALAAQGKGADVLVIERDATPWGTTGMSQGLFCAAGTSAQAAAGEADDAETFLADILAKTHGRTDPAIAHAIAYGSGPTYEWLAGEIGLPLGLDASFRPAYGNSTFRVHGWPGHNGTDLINLLHQKLTERGIPVLTEATLTDIIADESGRALGIEVQRPDGARERIGCETLVLASGGFAANHAMVAAHMPEAADARCNGHEGCQGDGIRLGQALGAAVGDMGSYQGYAMLTDPQGISVPPGVIIEGGILVNQNAKRFVDETADIAGMVHPALAQPGGLNWVILDAGIEARAAHIPEMRDLTALNAARRADTLEDLARQLGLDAEILAETLAEAHAAQAAARPDQLGRNWGADLPPKPPFRAFKVTGALYHTQGGLQIDGAAHVLRADGSRLPNIFAGGGAARGVSGPSSWGYLPAMGLCAALTLGRIAGENAAQQALA